MKKTIIAIISFLLLITLILGLSLLNKNTTNNATNNTNTSSDIDNTQTKNITTGGNYNLSGEYSSITIDTSDEVTINLDNVVINSENKPAINVVKAKKVNIILNGTNKIVSKTTSDYNAAIYSKSDLEFTGEGSLEIESNYDGIVSKDTLVINGGTYSIKADDDGMVGKDSVLITSGLFTINSSGHAIKSTNDEDSSLGFIQVDNGTFIINSTEDGFNANGDITIKNGEYTINSKADAIHTDGKLEIIDGTFNINAQEGLEATYVKIENGTINIKATDDGINAGSKSKKYSVKIEINGGSITIDMGQGDTDGIDSNGDLIINGGTISVNANSPFDYDGTAEYNGGTLIVNGTQTDTITNQFGGGMGGMRPRR